jgi:serine/threonine protein kinase
MALLAGAKLGPYEILSPIGAGGMGEVFKARDTRLDRIVAIKISEARFTERFEREARTVAALNHPNVCQLYDVGTRQSLASWKCIPANGTVRHSRCPGFPREPLQNHYSPHSPKTW